MRHRMLTRLDPALLRNPEFQSAMVRLAIWLFAVLYIGLGAASDYYLVDIDDYSLLFGGFLFLFLSLLASVIHRPVWEARRYFSLLMDVSATSFCIYLTKDIVSPFYLLYIWIFISYGTRYGKEHLKSASILSILAYTLVLTALGQWERYTFEVIFFLLLLIMLPLYQYVLLRKLHQARQEAEQSDQAKSIFLSCMTHELRTPLSGIMGMAQLLKNTPLNIEQKEYLESIVSSGSVLDSLISEVLDLSKMDAGGLELKPHLFDIRTLCRDVSQSLSHEALDKGLELICDVDERLPALVFYDELRLRQILSNLLSNALKFTASGEVVLLAKLISAEDEGLTSELCIEVRDTGIGIEPSHQEKLFERFWQADTSTTSHHGGIGLGTTISRRLTHLMGGEIGVISKPGDGSTFWVRLPLTGQGQYPNKTNLSRYDGFSVLIYETNSTSLQLLKKCCATYGIHCNGVSRLSELSEVVNQVEMQGGVDYAIVADSPSGQDIARIGRLIRKHLRSDLPVIHLGYLERKSPDKHPNNHFLKKPFICSDLFQQISTVLKEPLSTVAVLDGKRNFEQVKISVLMAEDNAINAKVLSTLLSGIGCSVAWARDGEEALAMALKGRYDIAFIDLRMPKLDGLAFTREWRAGEKANVRLPIIALTANTSASVRLQCAEAGMDDFLAKPVDEQLLQKAIERYSAVGTG
ncbi:MAG: response regulator [Sedimenticola selenatireducens]|uniref:histidine kinase n=2 Tax=Sedimenticola selenatireducens TaxID=191960 RepID=A0A558E0N9_9GAMM|nr:response regulator [Sedimenticola selenatireducens]TVT66924.1 MAG: response regulator [Sedimenticola selenatireducens]